MQSNSVVHSIETTADSIDPPLYRSVCLKHCRTEFIATQQLYRHLDSVEGRNREEALLKCRTRAWFVRNKTDGSVRVASNSCRLRWCPVCAQSRQNYIRHSVHEWFQTADHPKFLTVTVKHSQECLTDQINKLYNAWRKLRRDPFVTSNCTGGLWFFQLCWNPERHEWHPHIHAIVTGKYMDYKLLRKRWLEYTGDSQVLVIKTIKDPKQIGNYVARYAARPCQLSTLPLKEAVEAMTCLYGRRIAGSWGNARIVSFRPKRVPDPENFEYMGSWSTIHHLAKWDDNAKAILKAYHCNLPLGEGRSCYDFESFIDGLGQCNENELEVDPKPPPTLFG